MKDDIASGFKDVDRAADFAVFASCLNLIDSLPHFAERSSSVPPRTPFISFFMPPEILALACEAGFRDIQHVSAATLAERYFTGRADGLRRRDG